MLTLTRSNDEALVLHEFLARGAYRDLPKDPAEERVLWDLECSLVARLGCVLRPDHAETIERARQRLRGEPK